MNTAGEETGVAQLLPLQLAEAGQVVPGGVLAVHLSTCMYVYSFLFPEGLDLLERRTKNFARPDNLEVTHYNLYH